MEEHSLQQLVISWIFPSIVGAFAAFVLGIIWYHPKVLGGKWLEARNLTPDDFKRHTSPFVLSFPLWFLSALFYTFLLFAMHIDSSAEIFLFSCLLWVAFAMPPLVMASLYTGYPFNAVAIDAAFQLAGYYALGVVHIFLRSCGINF
jgi:hypothetical protein